MLAWEKGWGEQKIIMYRGTPAHFFSVLTESFFAKLGERGCPNLFGWVGLVIIFGDKMSSDTQEEYLNPTQRAIKR